MEPVKKTVVRAGYGLSYFATFNPSGTQGFSYSTPYNNSPDGGITFSGNYLQNPYPTGILSPPAPSGGCPRSWDNPLPSRTPTA